MIDFNNNIYLGVASPNMERDLSNYYTKAQTRALVDTKQDIITGAASTITNSNLTTNRAVISNGSGKVAVSNVTSTELGYLSGVTSEVQTQLNNKASTSLDNLSANGQMIIDTQNGTISNCVLDIPQNIKLEVSGKDLTIKAGSILTFTGQTYITKTLTVDYTRTDFTLSQGRYMFFFASVGAYFSWANIEKMGSGNELPIDNTNYDWYFLTSDKMVYRWLNNQWTIQNLTYPICVIDVDSDGNLSFAKDSNGNDMIFNGAGFIGRHAFVYPNVKALIPDGLNADGSLKSIQNITNSLMIIELKNTPYSGLYPREVVLGDRNDAVGYIKVQKKSDVTTLNANYLFQYCAEDNLIYEYISDVITHPKVINLISYDYNGTTVTNFTIRQPVKTATVEMLDKKQNDITTITGYDATKTQTLKNVNGTLTWVDD